MITIETVDNILFFNNCDIFYFSKNDPKNGIYFTVVFFYTSSNVRFNINKSHKLKIFSKGKYLILENLKQCAAYSESLANPIFPKSSLFEQLKSNFRKILSDDDINKLLPSSINLVGGFGINKKPELESLNPGLITH